MKKKGFTLVELLAVIAILAILVIVAMPNVLGMFNQAKANTFVTEVQEYMNTATTQFMQNALSVKGSRLYFGNGNTFDATKVSLGTLDMSGTEKNYFIQMDRNGKFERVIIYDDNFCYDSDKTGPTVAASGALTVGTTKLGTNGFEKTDIKVTDVYERNTSDNVNVTGFADDKATVSGCAPTALAQQ